MANEIENVLHAALRVNGSGGAAVQSGAGIIDASVTRTGAGVYEFDMGAGLAESEAVCASSVEEGPGATARIVCVEHLTPTRYRVRTYDEAAPAVAADGVWSVTIFRARTGT